MNEEQKTLFSANLGDNKPMLTINADSKVFCLDESTPEGKKCDCGCKTCRQCMWIAVALLAAGVCAAVWLMCQDFSVLDAKIVLNGIASAKCHFSTWPFVTLIVALLTAVVSLFQIGCRYKLRLEKLASEERRQRFDMRRFLVEKSIDYSEKQAKAGAENDKKKGDNGSAYSISITVNKKLRDEGNDNFSDKPPHSDGASSTLGSRAEGPTTSGAFESR